MSQYENKDKNVLKRRRECGTYLATARSMKIKLKKEKKLKKKNIKGLII